MNEPLSSDEHLFRVHAICRYLRGRPDSPCELCPATFTEPNYGQCVRGCFALAEEVLNIAAYGHPHGEKGIELHGQKWREHFNAE